jgi:hypothetical protein
MSPRRSSIVRWTGGSSSDVSMQSVKIFAWWFVVGATMALAVIMLQGGLRELMHIPGPLWELKLVELLTPIVGGGLLGGCIALILDRIKKP